MDGKLPGIIRKWFNYAIEEDFKDTRMEAKESVIKAIFNLEHLFGINDDDLKKINIFTGNELDQVNFLIN